MSAQSEDVDVGLNRWRWDVVTAAPIAVAVFASVILWGVGDIAVSNIGAVPEHSWAWALVPASAFTHLNSGHLIGAVAAWVILCLGARRTHLPISVAYSAVAGWAAGVAAWVFLGDNRHLHGASAGICAFAVVAVLRCEGKWRWTAVAVAAAAAISGTGTAGIAHAAGLAAGAVCAAAAATFGWWKPVDAETPAARTDP